MDKRWIGIFIIIIIAGICGYFIATSSNNVGNAITDVNKSTVTLPSGFSIKDDTLDSATLFNKNTGCEIYVKDLGKTDVASAKFNSQLEKLSSDEDIDIINNTTDVEDDYTLYSILYKNGTEYMSVSYIFKNNHTYLIKCSGFDDADDLTEKINFISDTLEPDYKKSQD